MDYYKIGMRIRKIRKAKRMTQEELSYQAGISVQHMCHIENGNTKLSLSVLVKLAQALDVRTDDLLFDIERYTVNTAMGEMAEILEGCNERKARIIVGVAKATKEMLESYE